MSENPTTELAPPRAALDRHGSPSFQLLEYGPPQAIVAAYLLAKARTLRPSLSEMQEIAQVFYRDAEIESQLYGEARLRLRDDNDELIQDELAVERLRTWIRDFGDADSDVRRPGGR